MRSKRSNFEFFEGLVKMASNATGALPDISTQIKTIIKDRVNEMISELDLVTREDFERIEMIALRARERQEQLEKRVAQLEKKTPAKTAKLKKARK